MGKRDKSPAESQPGPNAEPPWPAWPPQWPEIHDRVVECVTTGQWGRYRGRFGQALLEQLHATIGVEHCRLVSSGSIGVEIALRSAGVTAGDSVALCGYDYPGNFRAIELLGARPMLVDAAANGFSICPHQLESVHAPQIRAVLVSHLYGIPAAIGDIRRLCDDRGWRLIEDACQTPGMEIEGRPAGQWGDVSVLSFGGSKPLTAGNGGAVLTDDPAIASRWNRYADRPSDATAMSELQAAALLPQLDRLADSNRVRAATLQFLLERVAWLTPALSGLSPETTATVYKLAGISEQRDGVVGTLGDAGLPVGAGYRSMHRSSDRRCDKAGPLRRSARLGEQVWLLDHSVLLATGPTRDRLARVLCDAF